MSEERLQKVLARAGIASRRKSEDLIAEGRVTVDGRVVKEMGTKVDPTRQDIRCDGRRIRPQAPVYYLLNKPSGVLCTNAAPPGVRRAVDLVPGAPEGLFTVGRLDKESEGLIILTNDGEFANRVAHPRYGVPKTYLVDVQGAVGPEQEKRLARGAFLDGRRVRPQRLVVLQRSPARSRIEVTLGEGRKREVRRLFASLGLPVSRLRRTAIAALRLGALAPGRCREMTPEEVRILLEWAPAAKQKPRRVGPRAPRDGTERAPGPGAHRRATKRQWRPDA